MNTKSNRQIFKTFTKTNKKSAKSKVISAIISMAMLISVAIPIGATIVDSTSNVALAYSASRFEVFQNMVDNARMAAIEGELTDHQIYSYDNEYASTPAVDTIEDTYAYDENMYEECDTYDYEGYLCEEYECEVYECQYINIMPLSTDGFTWVNNADPGTTATLTGWCYIQSGGESLPTDLVIPTTIVRNGITRQVTRLGVANDAVGAFRDRGITTLQLHNGITRIYNRAFRGNNLTNLVIPNSVTEIRMEAFFGNNISSLTLGDGVEVIGGLAFTGNNITSLTLPNNLREIATQAFSNNNISGHLGIPDSVTVLASHAFAGNNLTSLTIGNSLTEIGQGAFANNNLTDLEISNSVVTIRGQAFFNNNLTHVSIPDSVQVIGGPISGNPSPSELSTFAYNELVSVDLGANVRVIGPQAFMHNNIRELVIPDSVDTIRNNAFWTNHLTNIDFGNGLRLIQSGAFSANHLVDVVIPDSVTSIQSAAFMNNHIMDDALIEDIRASVNTVADSAFNSQTLVCLCTYYFCPGHDMGIYELYLAPTCLEDGIEISHCTRIGCTHDHTRSIPAIGHYMGEWFVVRYPTLEEDGLERRDCTRYDCCYYHTRPLSILAPPYEYRNIRVYYYLLDENGVMERDIIHNATGRQYTARVGDVFEYLHYVLDRDEYYGDNDYVFEGWLVTVGGVEYSIYGKNLTDLHGEFTVPSAVNALLQPMMQSFVEYEDENNTTIVLQAVWSIYEADENSGDTSGSAGGDASRTDGSDKDKLPQTGIESSIALWATLLALVLLVTVFAIVKIKKSATNDV